MQDGNGTFRAGGWAAYLFKSHEFTAGFKYDTWYSSFNSFELFTKIILIIHYNFVLVNGI
jgi:L-ascorbate metabolism protein UlaG (beta-lactamase superfamily)